MNFPTNPKVGSSNLAGRTIIKGVFRSHSCRNTGAAGLKIAGVPYRVWDAKAESSDGFGVAPIVNSHNMNNGSPSENGIIHRDTIFSYCGNTKAVRLLITYVNP